MKQLNLQLSKDFLRDLKNFMELGGIRTKSEAIRVAVKRALAELSAQNKSSDFRGLLGRALKAPLRTPRFKDEDSLWDK